MYKTPSCDTSTSCWLNFYDNFGTAKRKTETYNQQFTSTYGTAQDRQLLIVYYPMPMLSKLWDNRSSEDVNGVTYHGIYSAAIWVNDPSVGVF